MSKNTGNLISNDRRDMLAISSENVDLDESPSAASLWRCDLVVAPLISAVGLVIPNCVIQGSNHLNLKSNET